jgi:hypothetical protein
LGTLEKRLLEVVHPGRRTSTPPFHHIAGVFPGPDPETMEVMAYRVFVTDGQVYEFPDHAAMVIDGSDYVFVVGDDEISRLPCDDVRDVEDSAD